MSTAIGSSILDSSLYIPDLKLKRKDTVLREMVARAQASGVVRDLDSLCEAVLLRERLGTTAIGKGVAIPYARSLAVAEPRLVFARSKRGIDWDAADALPVQLILMVLSPAEFSEESHYDMIARTVGVARLQRNRQKLIEAPDFQAVTLVLREAGA